MKLMNFFCGILSTTLMLFSCNENKNNKTFEVKHISTEEMKNSKQLNIAVVNDIDPVCGMKTKDYLSDTASYKKNIYGFCSTSCKNEFLKNPSKYIHE